MVMHMQHEAFGRDEVMVLWDPEKNRQRLLHINGRCR